MEQKDYWDSVSAHKDFTTPFRAAEFENSVRKDALIVDVGCGYGRTLNELHDMGYHNLIGLDFSEGMIARGRAGHPHLDLRRMEDGVLPLPDHSADAVILLAVLTCIPENEKQVALIREIDRVLKQGGIFCVNDFLLNSDGRNIRRYQRFHPKYGVYGVFELPEGAVCRHHDEVWIHRLLASFSPLAWRHVSFTTMNGHASNGFSYLGRKPRPESKAATSLPS